MKPIHIVAAKGPDLMTTLGGLQELVNTHFKDKNFTFKQLMTISNKGIPSIGNMSGNEFTCLAVLEADTMEDLQDILKIHQQGSNLPYSENGK